VRQVRPEWFFHLAAHGAYPSQTNLQEMVRTNLVGTINLLKAGLGAGFEAFVNAGSSSEYGLKDHPPSETEWLEPNSDYAVTKAAATHYCSYVGRRDGVHVVTLRLYSAYGPFEEPSRLMPTLVSHGLRGTLPPLVTPNIARDYVYVSDVADAFVRAAAQLNQPPGAVYNVGTGVQTYLWQAVETARTVLGIRAEPAWGSMPHRQWDTTTWIADRRTITEALDWTPRYTFEDGFRQFVRWVQDTPFCWPQYGVARDRAR